MVKLNLLEKGLLRGRERKVHIRKVGHLTIIKLGEQSISGNFW